MNKERCLHCGNTKITQWLYLCNIFKHIATRSHTDCFNPHSKCADCIYGPMTFLLCADCQLYNIIYDKPSINKILNNHEYLNSHMTIIKILNNGGAKL